MCFVTIWFADRCGEGCSACDLPFFAVWRPATNSDAQPLWAVPLPNTWLGRGDNKGSSNTVNRHCSKDTIWAPLILTCLLAALDDRTQMTKFASPSDAPPKASGQSLVAQKGLPQGHPTRHCYLNPFRHFLFQKGWLGQKANKDEAIQSNWQYYSNDRIGAPLILRSICSA